MSFRPLAISDLPQLHAWLNRSHVLEFYGQRPTTLEDVTHKYGPRLSPTSPVQPWLIFMDSHPAGYVQWYWLVDLPPIVEGLCNLAGAAGLDVFIGESAWLGRGLGSAAIAAFIHEVLIPEYGVERILVDPADTNTRAIRAYEKVGFLRVAGPRFDEDTAPYYMLFDPGISSVPAQAGCKV